MNLAIKTITLKDAMILQTHVESGGTAKLYSFSLSPRLFLTIKKQIVHFWKAGSKTRVKLGLKQSRKIKKSHGSANIR